MHAALLSACTYTKGELPPQQQIHEQCVLFEKQELALPSLTLSSKGRRYELATAKETSLCRLAAMRMAVFATSTPKAVQSVPEC